MIRCVWIFDFGFHGRSPPANGQSDSWTPGQLDSWTAATAWTGDAITCAAAVVYGKRRWQFNREIVTSCVTHCYKKGFRRPKGRRQEEIVGRKIVNISMPSDLYDWVSIRVSSGRYGSVSEYFRELVKLDERRETFRVNAIRKASLESRPYPEFADRY